MKEFFKDILDLDDVKGIIMLSFDGELVFSEFSSSQPRDKDHLGGLFLFVHALEGVREADLIFENVRFYMRKTDVGYLIIEAGLYAPIAMIRLNCDLILPALKGGQAKKSQGRFFKKKR